MTVTQDRRTDVGKPQVEPLENDHHDLYARTSDFLNRNDIESIFISGSVDSASDDEPDLHILRHPSGLISIDTDDGSGEGSYIYSSHIEVDGTAYPSPNLARGVSDEQMTRLDAVLSGEVDIHAPSSWDLYMTTGEYGTYKPQENTLTVGIENHIEHTTLNVKHKGLTGRVILQVGDRETPNFPVFQGSGYYAEGMPEDPEFIELLNASFQADFTYEKYPEFNNLSPGSDDWNRYLSESFQDIRLSYAPGIEGNIPEDAIQKLMDAHAGAFEKIVGAPDQAKELLIEKEPSFYEAAIDYMGLGPKINAQAEKTIPAHGDRGAVTVEQHQDRIVMHHALPKGSSKAFDTVYMSNRNKGVDIFAHELTYDQKRDLMLAMEGRESQGLSLDEGVTLDAHIYGVETPLKEAGLDAFGNYTPPEIPLESGSVSPTEMYIDESELALDGAEETELALDEFPYDDDQPMDKPNGGDGYGPKERQEELDYIDQQLSTLDPGSKDYVDYSAVRAGIVSEIRAEIEELEEKTNWDLSPYSPEYEQALERKAGLEKILERPSDKGITNAQLQAEVDRLTAKLDGLDPVSAEYEATAVLRSSFEDIRVAKGYSEALPKPEHPDLEFFKEIFAAAQEHGQGDYGIADVELSNGITLRGSHGSGRIFKDGETIVQFESMNSGGYGINHPIKAEGSITPELKQLIRREIEDLGKSTGRDDSLPPGYSRDPSAFEEPIFDQLAQIISAFGSPMADAEGGTLYDDGTYLFMQGEHEINVARSAEGDYVHHIYRNLCLFDHQDIRGVGHNYFFDHTTAEDRAYFARLAESIEGRAQEDAEPELNPVV